MELCEGQAKGLAEKLEIDRAPQIEVLLDRALIGSVSGNNAAANRGSEEAPTVSKRAAQEVEIQGEKRTDENTLEQAEE
jgi:hypothetical protein